MGFMDEYYKALEDNKQKSSPASSGGSGGSNSGGSGFMAEYYKVVGNAKSSNTRSSGYSNDVAPTSERISSRLTVSNKKKKKEEEEKKRKWFEKGLFEDGYDFGDISRTILGSTADVLENVGSGIIGMGEKAVDAMAYIAPYAANSQFYQNGGFNLETEKAHRQAVEQSKTELEKFIAKDLYDEQKVARAIISDPARKIGVDSETQSVFGEKSDALIQSGGQLLATAGLSAVGVPWWLTTGATSFGGEAENALNQGATYEQAGASAAISAGAEILSEKLSGGISFGGKTLDDVLTKQLARGISNKLGRTAAKLGLDMFGEGAEEVFSQVASNLGSSLYKEEDITELLFNEEAMDGYLESFIGGAALGGVAGGYKAIKSNSKGVDYASDMTQNEQKVVDKLYKDEVASREKQGKLTQKEKSKIYDSIIRDLEKGYISTDTIEEVLGGDSYENYKKTLSAEDAQIDNLNNQLKELEGSPNTVGNAKKYDALQAKLETMNKRNKSNDMQNRLYNEVYKLANGDRLAESYKERSRRGQAYQADLTQYDDNQQKVIQKAIDSGILNNTNRTHEFVDIIAKISADKGVLFDFTNNAKLKESGFAVDGKQVNGFVTENGITLNIDSPKAWQSTVGHEITHVLEGTELYTELQNTILEYAKSKGDYQGRYDSLTELYKNVQSADINAELTADLVGEYLFADEKFIKNLSSQNRNVFQKIFDEIKYLYKVATAGSKEARELEKVKKAFEKAYREGGKTQGETKYSVSETTDGRFAAVVDSDILSNIDTTSWDKDKKAEAKKAASEALKQFSDGIVVDGITRKVNKVSRREYTRSEYTESLYNHAPDVFADKMRAADVADDIVIAATNWNRDGGLKHPRTDNFVDFDHGKTLIVSGNAKYSAEVVVGITDAGDAVFYDVVDMTPTTFDIKKAESPTTATTQNAIGDIQGDSFDTKVAQKGEKVKYSLSVDSDGRQLTEGQEKFFQESQGRDDEGNLATVYHTSPSAGFTVFEGSKGDGNYKFGKYGSSVTYFTDNREMSSSYSPYIAPLDMAKLDTLGDANKWLSDVSNGSIEIRKNGENFTAFDTEFDEIIPSINYTSEEALLRNLKRDIQMEFGDPEAGGQYEGYVNIKNPLVVDAKGRAWNDIQYESTKVESIADFIEEIEKLSPEEKAFIQKKYDEALEKAKFDDRDVKDVFFETVEHLPPWESEKQKMWWSIRDRLFFANETRQAEKTSYFFDAIANDFSTEGMQAEFTSTVETPHTTNAIVMKALEDGSYDGVIIKNVIDYGGNGGTKSLSADEYKKLKPGNLYVVFNSNQFKAADNLNPTADPDIRYSLSDSNGRQLSEEQTEYFKDSKVRDENGSLKVMYHGSPESFTTFDKKKAKASGLYGKGFYFSDSNSHAKQYGNTYEVYLNITNPLQNGTNDITKDQLRKFVEAIADDEDYGIENYGYEATVDSVTSNVFGKGDFAMLMDINVTCVGNMVEAVELFNKVNGTDYNGIIAPTETVAFYPEQIKEVANQKPTADPDIRFSLSKPVEETKDLIAVHNLKSAELVETLKLSGLPSPSVAIIKAKDGHEAYGDVSLILPKETIDPQKNKANRIYGSDAWTPTRSNAQVEYEVDYGIQRKFERTIEELSKNVANGIFSKSSVLGMAGIEDSTGLNLNEIAKTMSEYNAVQAAYVAEHGGNVDVVYRTKQFDTYGNDALKGYLDKVGEQEVARLTAKMMTGERLTAEEIETAKDSLVDNWIEKKDYALRQKPELREIRISRFRERLNHMRVEDFVRHAWEFYEDSGATTDEIDQGATGSNLHSAVNKSDVEAWVAEKLQGLLSEPGVYNGKEIFTPSGRRRSFKETHWDYTAENIVRAMNNADARGANVWNVSGEAIIATATPEYKNIDEVRADKGRLFKAEYEDYEQIKDGISEELQEVTKDIIRTTEHISDNQYDEEQIIGRVIMEAAQGIKSVAGVKRVFQKNGYRIGDAQAKSVLSLFDHASSVPTGYFEAKPQRVVGFDEVGVYVIPYDADVKLKQELLNQGYSIAEYDPKVEGDRTRVLNQFEEYKFSLSNVGEQHTPNSLSAMRLATTEDSTDIAPVSQTTAETKAPNPKTNIAPTVAKNETVAEAPVTADDMSALFPDNAVPEQAELEQLMYERDQIYSALEDAINVGSANDVGRLAEEYEALNTRIKALESGDSERTGSLGDADVPPEMEAPYQPGGEDYEGTPETVDDPFEQRDIGEVGKQSVKAYQYENPEVKPFFQEAALGMLYDVRNTTKGEKWYNDELYYATGGEQGFGGTKRHTTDDIAELKDVYGYTYEQIENGLNAIIEDDGKENNAVSKRIEFMLNDRLLDGYTDVDGRRYEPNQGYIKLLNEKQITEYSKESFDQLMANADQYAPSLEESYAPILNSDPRYEQPVPGYDLPSGQQTYVPTKTTYDAEPTDDVAPTTTALGSKEVSGQQSYIQNGATYDATPTDDIAPLFDATGKKGVPDGQQAFMPDSGVDVKQTRKEYHQGIIDSIKSRFKEAGFDLDKVLDKAKNLSTWSTVDNTPQRVMEKALGYKEGGILADITVNKVAQNESEGIKWLNSYVDQLKQISKQYGIKPGSKESAAAQMYAEGFYVNDKNEIVRYGDPELIQDFGNGDVRRRIKALARDPRIRKIYDDTLANINESRTRNLYPEIPRLDNYFLHFRAMEDTFSTLGLPFNPNDIRAKDLPTDLNGVTADLKPGQPYFSSAMHRKGKRTSFDLLGGVERYLNSAKNQIYHIDDIQTLRALRNYVAETYGQATGLEDIDSMTDAEAEERIKQVYGSHLSTFAKFLNEEANVLAGKTALIDRGVEGIIGRRGITFLNTLNKQVGSNMVGYNISSSLTNFLPVAQTFAKTNKFDFTKAFAQTVANKITGGRFDSFADDSPVVIRRKGEDRFYRTPWQKMADPGYALMGMVDDISTEIIARTKYNEFTRKGMDSQKAHFETDKWVSKLMGDRSIGQQPQLYNSKMLGLFTKFQLEVRNQLDSQFYDTIQETKVSNEHIQNGLARNAKTAAKVASVFAQLAVAQHLYGMAFESVAGYNPAFDIIEVLMTAFGYDDEEDSEDTLKDNLGQGFEAFMEDLPYASIVTGGGRIPISSALPIKEFFKGEDQYGNEKSRWETLGEVAPYYLMPGGYGQLKKTTQGLKMFSDDHPIAGSYTDAGNLRYDVEDTVGSRIKAGIFGQYASENAQKYFDQEQRTLNPEQTKIFAGLDMPIEEYWEYRDNLYEFYDVKDQLKEAAYADGATDEDVLRYTYINNVYGDIYDLYDKQKELANGNSRNKKAEMRDIQTQMEKMLSESKYAVDSMKLSGAYAEVGGVRYNKDADSGRWYEIKPKNADGSDNWYYQKEQEVTKGLGISYEEYWNNREEYNYAYDKPGKYAIAQAVGGYDSYREYYDALENWQSDSYIAADKDDKGNSISGSRKNKVIEYINGLDLDYGERLILYRTVYSSKADKRAYNMEIINYLNERDDISYQQMKMILEELEMEVDSKGNITW